MNSLDVAGADVVAVEEGADVGRVAVLAQSGDIVHGPFPIEQGAQVPGGVERVAGIAEAIGAVFAAAHLDHAFPD